MNRDALFRGLVKPTTAVRRLPIYQTDGRFRLIVAEITDPERAFTLTPDDFILYIGYLLTVIVDISDDGPKKNTRTKKSIH